MSLKGNEDILLLFLFIMFTLVKFKNNLCSYGLILRVK